MLEGWENNWHFAIPPLVCWLFPYKEPVTDSTLGLKNTKLYSLNLYVYNKVYLWDADIIHLAHSFGVCIKEIFNGI